MEARPGPYHILRQSQLFGEAFPRLLPLSPRRSLLMLHRLPHGWVFTSQATTRSSPTDELCGWRSQHSLWSMRILRAGSRHPRTGTLSDAWSRVHTHLVYGMSEISSNLCYILVGDIEECAIGTSDIAPLLAALWRTSMPINDISPISALVVPLLMPQCTGYEQSAHSVQGCILYDVLSPWTFSAVDRHDLFP